MALELSQDKADETRRTNIAPRPLVIPQEPSQKVNLKPRFTSPSIPSHNEALVAIFLPKFHDPVEQERIAVTLDVQPGFSKA